MQLYICPLGSVLKQYIRRQQVCIVEAHSFWPCWPCKNDHADCGYWII